MAETLGSVSAIRKQSVARLELFTDAHLAPDDWRIVIHFEDALYDDKGVMLSGSQQFGTRRIERRFSDIKGDKDVAALMQAIKGKAYAWRAEDVAGEEMRAAEAAKLAAGGEKA